MSTVLDQTTDLSGTHTYRIMQLYTTPEFVKQASQTQICGGEEELPQHVFGDMARRLYPCHTKAATWMSAAFFREKCAAEGSPATRTVEQRILQAAEYWQIKPDVQRLWEQVEKAAAHEETQLMDDDFALVWEVGEHKERKYPLRNALEVKMASEWFKQYHTELAYPDKQAIARKILTKVAAYGAAVADGDLLDRCAGYGYCTVEDAQEAWAKRARLLKPKNAAWAKAAQDMADTLDDAIFESRDFGLRSNMATLMDQFDTTTNLNQYYENGLARPEEVLFAVTEKQAADFVKTHVQTTTGAVYEKAALEKISVEDVQQWLGDDFADSLGTMLSTDELADMVSTLPRPDAEMFDRLADSRGIRPVGSEKLAAVGRDELSEVVFQTLAADYKQRAGKKD